jgi:hypothetical protein
VNKAEMVERFTFIDTLFDRIAGRHKSMGKTMADLERRVALLEALHREPPSQLPLSKSWDVV